MADYAIHDTTLTGISNVIRKKDGTSALIDPADYADRINLMGMLEEKTVSGAIATFADGADAVPLKKCEITLPASLDGYSSVDIIHAGKNLWEFGVQTVDTVAYIMLYFTKPLPAGTYTISCELISTTTTCSFRFRKEDGSYLVQTAFTANAGRVSQTLTLPEPAYRVYIYSSTQAGGEVTTWKNVQIEVGATMTDFEAYETPTTHTANLGRTIHGGKSDVANGQGSGEWATVKLKDLTWYYSTSYGGFFHSPSIQSVVSDETYICDSSEYTNVRLNSYQLQNTDDAIGINADNGSAVTGGAPLKSIVVKDTDFSTVADLIAHFTENDSELCYKQATPEPFTFDPVPIDSKLGNNTLWAEQGSSVEVTYRSQGTVYQYPEGEGVSF